MVHFFFSPSRSVAKPKQNKPCLHPRQADYVCRQPKQIIPPATRSEPGVCPSDGFGLPSEHVGVGGYRLWVHPQPTRVSRHPNGDVGALPQG